MRSHDRVARVALLVLALACAALAVAATISRSLIPHAMDTDVGRIEVRHEKHPGVDDVWIVHLDATSLHVDAAIAQRLDNGMSVRKDAWDTTVTADGQEIPLALSRDARSMLWVMPLTLLSAAAASRRWRPRA